MAQLIGGTVGMMITARVIAKEMKLSFKDINISNKDFEEYLKEVQSITPKDMDVLKRILNYTFKALEPSYMNWKNGKEIIDKHLIPEEGWLIKESIFDYSNQEDRLRFPKHKIYDYLYKPLVNDLELVEREYVSYKDKKTRPSDRGTAVYRIKQNKETFFVLWAAFYTSRNRSDIYAFVDSEYCKLMTKQLFNIDAELSPSYFFCKFRSELVNESAILFEIPVNNLARKALEEAEDNEYPLKKLEKDYGKKEIYKALLINDILLCGNNNSLRDKFLTRLKKLKED